MGVLLTIGYDGEAGEFRGQFEGLAEAQLEGLWSETDIAHGLLCATVLPGFDEAGSERQILAWVRGVLKTTAFSVHDGARSHRLALRAGKDCVCDGHPNQFLAVMAEVFPPWTEVAEVGGEPVTIELLVREAMGNADLDCEESSVYSAIASGIIHLRSRQGVPRDDADVVLAMLGLAGKAKLCNGAHVRHAIAIRTHDRFLEAYPPGIRDEVRSWRDRMVGEFLRSVRVDGEVLLWVPGVGLSLEERINQHAHELSWFAAAARPSEFADSRAVLAFDWMCRMALANWATLDLRERAHVLYALSRWPMRV